MNYVERLIHRALAAPRQVLASVFDPFEQTALWPVDPPALARSEPTQGAASVREAASPRPSDLPISPPQLEPPVARDRVVETLVARTIEPAVPELKAWAHRSETAPVAPQPVAPTTAQESALAKADAFIRGLSVKALAPDAPRPSELRLPRTQTVEARASAKVSSGDDPPAPLSPRPQLVRPVPPRLSFPQSPAARKPAERASSAASPTPPTQLRQRSAVAVAQGIVTRTVVVAPSAPSRLDDLAHSSAISRFGIGQG
jgi:hypothetical protein